MEITNLKEPGRRVRLYAISCEVLPFLLQDGVHHHITDGIPKTAKLVGTNLCPYTGSILLQMEDAAFDLVKSGEEAAKFFIQARVIRGRELDVVRKMIEAHENKTPQKSEPRTF